MPIYEYVCTTCGNEFEAIQKFSDDPLTACTCGESGKVERKLSLSAFQLKGGGWYKDLYGGGKGNGKNGASASEAKSGSKAEGKSESKDSGASSGSAESSAPAATGGGTGCACA